MIMPISPSACSHYRFGGIMLLALTLIFTLSISTGQVSPLTFQSLPRSLHRMPSVRLRIQLTGANMQIHGQSVFDVFANPILSAAENSLHYDGFAHFIQEDYQFTYVFVNGIGYVVESKGNETTSVASQTTRCLSSISPFDDIIAALNNLTAISSESVAQMAATYQQQQHQQPATSQQQSGHPPAQEMHAGRQHKQASRLVAPVKSPRASRKSTPSMTKRLFKTPQRRRGSELAAASCVRISAQETQEDNNLGVALGLIATGIPFRVVENPHFQAMFDYELPSRRHISGRLQDKLYEREKNPDNALAAFRDDGLWQDTQIDLSLIEPINKSLAAFERDNCSMSHVYNPFEWLRTRRIYTRPLPDCSLELKEDVLAVFKRQEKIFSKEVILSNLLDHTKKMFDHENADTKAMFSAAKEFALGMELISDELGDEFHLQLQTFVIAKSEWTGKTRVDHHCYSSINWWALETSRTYCRK
ncbi:hypothetical protein F441_00336 [Phytophthora nicotianae CJ01A1]|uniref:Uncharacterized protein n=1 Tax=Phytophthora nicotianae CJ01A1 TaxID=1317063 RepID=W2XX60_PHYNI|nr:hypothetical protein F441_00336 [Phytophthora nicotianae CJ01A1]